jgi:hypothetical protein
LFAAKISVLSVSRPNGKSWNRHESIAVAVPAKPKEQFQIVIRKRRVRQICPATLHRKATGAVLPSNERVCRMNQVCGA